MTLQEIVVNNIRVSLRDLALEHDLASDIQGRLSKLGCLDPPADGDFGPVSTLVLREYAKQVGIAFDERIDAALAQSLDFGVVPGLRVEDWTQ